MKYTDEQKLRAAKKLARACGRWNMPGLDGLTRRHLNNELFAEAFKLIKKFGLSKEYQKAMRE